MGKIIKQNKISLFFENLSRKGFTFSAVFSAFISGYIIASFYEVFKSENIIKKSNNTALRFTNVDFVNNVSSARMIIITVLIGLVLIGASVFISKVFNSDAELSHIGSSEKRRFSVLPIHLSLFFSSIALAYELVVAASLQMFDSTFSEASTRPHADLVFIVGIAAVMIIIIKYLSDDDKLMLGKLSSTRVFSSWKIAYAVVAVCAIAVCSIFTIYTYYRYLSFSSATFDLGIFTQMFEKMASTGLPFTTVERANEMSHFAVHFSPSWYLLLPSYLLFRSPFYFYLINSVLITLGAFPIFRIAKKSGASPLESVAFSLIYLFFPSMSGGLFFDIHENSLLPVLILYTVYFYIDKKTVPMLIFAFLTLGVKEDSVIYIATLALYIIFSDKRKLKGFILLAISIAYFFFASKMIAVFGGTVMSLRLEAYYPSGAEQSGFLTPIKTVMFNIGYFIKKVFDTSTLIPERPMSEAKLLGDGKLQFLIWMLLPTLFAPFLSKKNSLLFLLIPLVMENLMLTWPYQYDVYYQYAYGPAALIVVASVLAISSMNKNTRRTFLLCSVVLCIIMSGALFWPKALRYEASYKDNKEQFDLRQATIEQFIDDYYTKGDSVATTDMEVSHIASVTDIRLINSPYQRDIKADWVLISVENSELEEHSFLKTDYECMNPNDPSDFRIFKKNAK